MEARKTVLVTGCSEGGIGEALAREFQARGLHVFATARSESKMASLHKLANVTVLPLDVTCTDSIAAAVTAVSAKTGGKLDYLVNNAGTQIVMPVLDFDIQQAKAMFDVNLWGVLAMVQAFMPLILATKGTIVNLSSIGALSWLPYKAVYGSSKSAVVTLSEGLRVELKPFGVKVATVLVGGVDTNIFENAPEYHLPPGSLYKPIEKEIGDCATGRDISEGMLGRREDFAYSLVKDILGGATGKIFRGNAASMVRILAAILPDFVMDRVVAWNTGLNRI
ncbi:oxidoreductase [Durotheca rogersii]|uniref:oxidoreductase n=1 Tax=Durotheca rogersii TaxID=419775 RepID=UPI00222108E6|nr:oxidoreductase [Durotheca rogersii]KAI5861442.1 oxidoreductase [Durotheca rogersii]